MDDGGWHDLGDHSSLGMLICHFLYQFLIRSSGSLEGQNSLMNLEKKNIYVVGALLKKRRILQLREI